MAEKKDEAKTMTSASVKTQPVHPAEGPVDLTQRVAMIAPEGAKYHKPGAETQVAASLVPHFEAKGYVKKK